MKTETKEEMLNFAEWRSFNLSDYAREQILKVIDKFAKQEAEKEAANKLKIYKVDFEGMYPVGSGLVLVANNYDEALAMAIQKITHTTELTITEVDISKPSIIIYLSGDY